MLQISILTVEISDSVGAMNGSLERVIGVRIHKTCCMHEARKIRRISCGGIREVCVTVVQCFK